MPFPQSDRLLFQKNPLAEVVCQLRFPPILSIASAEPASFQDKIRDEYPLYERTEEIRIPQEIESLVRNLPVQLASGINHKFATADNQRTISLTRDFIAYSDLNYKRWEDFHARLIRAVNALEAIYKPAFYSRVGLRYRDVVDRVALGLNDAAWNELLHPWVLGLLAEESVSDSIVSTQSKTTIRVTEADDKAFVTIRYGFPQNDTEVRDVYSIDADFFTTGRIEGNRASEVLGIFNRRAGDLFRWCIKHQLRQALEPRPLERVSSSS